MDNSIQSGLVLNWTATRPVTSGEVVVIGDFVGIASTTEPVGELVALCPLGVFALPKAGTVAYGLGTKLWWDEGNERVTPTAVVGRAPIGYVWEAAATTDDTVQVNLIPQLTRRVVGNKATNNQTLSAGTPLYLTNAGTLTSTAGSNTFVGLAAEAGVASGQSTITYTPL